MPHYTIRGVCKKSMKSMLKQLKVHRNAVYSKYKCSSFCSVLMFGIQTLCEIHKLEFS